MNSQTDWIADENSRPQAPVLDYNSDEHDAELFGLIGFLEQGMLPEGLDIEEFYTLFNLAAADMRANNTVLSVRRSVDQKLSLNHCSGQHAWTDHNANQYNASKLKSSSTFGSDIKEFEAYSSNLFSISQLKKAASKMDHFKLYAFIVIINDSPDIFDLFRNFDVNNSISVKLLYDKLVDKYIYSEKVEGINIDYIIEFLAVFGIYVLESPLPLNSKYYLDPHLFRSSFAEFFGEQSEDTNLS